MTLSAGSRIGPYEIVAAIGAGGMGEVYRARDAKLARDVALKVLPDEFALDSDRLARFTREAQVLASLNHQNIAAIYGFEENALVLEFVDGPTLADRIAQGAIPLDDALPIAKQIAEALEAAHDQGIIHRDLKPANIKVRLDGTVKVLDFGLAKLAQAPGPGPQASAGGLTLSPTITTPAMTQVGMILGTAAYMSPEQAKGREADKRSDIWAFGCVLFEMLTGKRAFDGDDVSDTLAAVLRGEANWAALPNDVPASIRNLLTGCLAKDRRQRVGDISTALFAMRQPFTARADAAAPRERRRRWVTVALAAVLGGIVVGIVLRNISPAIPPIPVARFTYALPQGEQFFDLFMRQIAISRDGTQVAYVANHRLNIRPLAEAVAHPIPGSETATSHNIGSPVFSPDGRSLVYWDRPTQGQSTVGALKRIPVSGGAAVTLADVDIPTSLSWEGDDLLIGQRRGGIVRVPASGGAPQKLVGLNENEQAEGAHLLPGGDAVLFTLVQIELQQAGLPVSEWDKASQVVVQSLSSGQRKVLMKGAASARYLPNGYLMFAKGATVYAAPFDPRRQEIKGNSVPMVEGVRRMSVGSFVAGGMQIDVSDTGSLIYLPGPASISAPDRQLVIVDRSGTTEPLKLPASSYGRPRVSPDGKQVTFQTDDGQQANVWVYNVSGSSPARQLTFTGKNRWPIWSADGTRVTFHSERDGEVAIYWKRADGTGMEERLTPPERPGIQKPESWSPNGRHLLFTKRVGNAVSLWQFSLDDRQVTAFGNVQGQIGVSEFGAAFSPDGSWVVYATPAPSRSAVQLFVQPFPTTGNKYLIASHADSPAWSRAGELVFLDLLGAGVMSAPFSAKSSFTLGNPVPLPESVSNILRSGRLGPGSEREFDVFPGGDRFISSVPTRDDQSVVLGLREISVVLHWTEELEQRVPR